MIISQRHRFIFIKTKKTAGSSVQQALGAICGPDCLITLARDRYLLPEGHGRAHRALGAHVHIAPVVRTFGAALAAYPIITCERNPFDKLISAYFFLRRRPQFQSDGSPPEVEFAARLRAGAFDGFMTSNYYCAENTPLADFIIRYEHLAEDFADMVARLGLPARIALGETRRKSNIRPDDYRGAAGHARLFTPALENVVRERYPFYFDTLGYSGPDSDCPAFQPDAARHGIRRRLEARAAAFAMQIPLPGAG